MEIFNLESTVLPCGNNCGVCYTIPRIALPAEIQAAAIHEGWGILEVDGRPVLACGDCLKKAKKSLKNPE